MEITEKQKEKIKAGITSMIEVITPEKAHEYLELNYDNRGLKERHIVWLANQMSANAWEVTHQGIAFDTKNHLRDGQHRLHAIIRSMKTQEILVTRGLKPASFTVMDTGRNRNAAEVLAIAGYPSNANTVGAGARLYLEFKQTTSSTWGKGNQGRITNTMILNFVKKNEDFVNLISSYIAPASHSRLLPIPMAAAFTWFFKDLKDSDLETAKGFFMRLYTGADLGENSAELFLRNWLIKDRNSLARVPKIYRIAMIIKGWNYFRSDRPIITMWSLRDDEKFPLPY